MATSNQRRTGNNPLFDRRFNKFQRCHFLSTRGAAYSSGTASACSPARPFRADDTLDTPVELGPAANLLRVARTRPNPDQDCVKVLGMADELTLADLRQRLNVPAIEAGLVHSALKTIVEALISLERRVDRLERGRDDDRRVAGLL